MLMAMQIQVTPQAQRSPKMHLIFLLLSASIVRSAMHMFVHLQMRHFAVQPMRTPTSFWMGYMRQ